MSQASRTNMITNLKQFSLILMAQYELKVHSNDDKQSCGCVITFSPSPDLGCVVRSVFLRCRSSESERGQCPQLFCPARAQDAPPLVQPLAPFVLGAAVHGAPIDSSDQNRVLSDSSDAQMAPRARLPLPFPGEINSTKKPSRKEPVSLKGFVHVVFFSKP